MEQRALSVRRRRHRGDVEDLLREAAPRVLAAVVRRFGDFADSEDAVQEAMIDAARQWPAQGTPESPTGWLIAVASRRMTDRIRADSARRAREERLAVEPEPGPTAEADDTLALIFMCCRPELTPASAIALTLRAVGGLSTAQIAAAFLVPEKTMGRRIARAKQTVAEAEEPFGLPAGGGTGGAAAHRALGPLPDLQRGLRGERGGRAGADRALRRGDPADPDRAAGAARGARGRRPAGADAADRRAPPRPHRRARRTGAAGRAGPLALGRGGDRRGQPGAGRGDRRGRRRPLPAAGGDRRRPRPGARVPRTPTGARSSPSTGCSKGSRRGRWWR